MTPTLYTYTYTSIIEPRPDLDQFSKFSKNPKDAQNSKAAASGARPFKYSRGALKVNKEDFKLAQQVTTLVLVPH